jgi:D-glycero-D-manno-heptose 1,7-bisphosphate phosphatase
MTPAVFLDRDGTMIHDVGYLARIEDLRWYPYTIDAIRLLRRAGFLVFVVTNQGGVGLGYYPESLVHETHETMAKTIDAAGAHVDGWYYCPHHPRAVTDALRIDCGCRKPKAGMVDQARQAFAIDLARSFVVGDKISDLQLARAIGARGAIVETGHGVGEVRRAAALPAGSVVRPDLMAAVTWMLAESGQMEDRL